MKKINKKDRIRPAKHRYYSILILILIVLVSAAAFSIYDKVYQLIEWNYFFIDSVGIACQIISGIVCCIQSILGLSISLQHQDFLGVPLSKYYTLRKTPYFDFKNSALVSFGLLLFSVSGYLFSLVVFCVAAACISVAFCIYVLNIEVPFLLLKEKTILSVVKDRMISEYTEDIKADDYQMKEFTEILESLICNKNLQWVYKQLSIKNEPTFNKSMLYRLMDVQSNMSFHLDQIESGISLVKATDVILGSVSDMTRSDFDIVEILGNNTREYVHLLTRVLFRLLDRPESKNKTEDTLAQMAACFFVPRGKRKYNSNRTVLFKKDPSLIKEKNTLCYRRCSVLQRLDFR